MSYYTIKAFSRESIQYKDPLVFIEPGINVFPLLTDDVEAFVKLLESDGVRVDEVNRLDGEQAHEGNPTKAGSLGLPQEEPFQTDYDRSYQCLLEGRGELEEG